ncbi:unnamed protein product, partial [Prorocentrum cordatum]
MHQKGTRRPARAPSARAMTDSASSSSLGGTLRAARRGPTAAAARPRHTPPRAAAAAQRAPAHRPPHARRGASAMKVQPENVAADVVAAAAVDNITTIDRIELDPDPMGEG